MTAGNHEPPQHAIVAVPLFGDEIAPRFCVAEEFMVVDVECGAITKRWSLALGDLPWVERIARLAECGVTDLLCGGFNRRFAPSAERKGIRVATFLAGNADDVVAAFMRGEVEDYRFPRRNPRGSNGHGRDARAAHGIGRDHCRRGGE